MNGQDFFNIGMRKLQKYKIIKVYHFLLNITTYFSVFLCSVLIYPGENLQIEKGIQPKENTDKHNII